MQVTFCSYDRPGSLGGPFSWLPCLLPSLRERGIDVRCLFLTHFGGTGPALESLRREGFECEVVNCHERTADQVRWILERLQRHPPDIFVPNLVVSAYHAGRWIRSAGIPTVGVLHSDDPFYKAIQDEFIFGEKSLRLSSVVCVSRELEAQVLLRQPTDTRVWRIPYGVAIPPAAVQHSRARFRMAYVGRLAEEQKRISDLTRAFIRVCREIPGAEAVIYGDGPARHAVESLLVSEGSGAAVRLAGSVPNSRIQDELLQCDVIALLSDYEGLPIALLEAMACGCAPVCLSMKSGVSELIRHEESGLIVTDRHQSFSAAIYKLAADVEIRRRMGTEARRTVATQFSHRASADQWATHLREFGAASSMKKLSIPRRILLPERNPVLESAPQRNASPSRFHQGLRKTRMWVGRMKRKMS